MDTGIRDLFQLRTLERLGKMREREIKGSQQSEAYFLFLICPEWALQVFVYPGTQLLKEQEMKKKIVWLQFSHLYSFLVVEVVKGKSSGTWGNCGYP